MKLLTVFALLAFCTACSSVNTKSDSAQSDATTSTTTITELPEETTLPTEEKAFVKAIELLDKKSIVAQLGEPAKADDVKIKGSNRIVETTELDFIDDKVVQVVFLNNDGSDVVADPEHTYELPK